MSIDRSSDFMYFDAEGALRRVSGPGIAEVPSEFSGVLEKLWINLRLAQDCLLTFDGIPVPVAHEILRNLEPVHVALDMAIKDAAASNRKRLLSSKSVRAACDLAMKKAFARNGMRLL